VRSKAGVLHEVENLLEGKEGDYGISD
jgi:hypothetical protein